MGNMEHRSVIYFCILGYAAAKLFGVPGIEVRVEMEDCDAAPGFVEGAEDGEGLGTLEYSLNCSMVCEEHTDSMISSN